MNRLSPIENKITSYKHDTVVKTTRIYVFMVFLKTIIPRRQQFSQIKETCFSRIKEHVTMHILKLQFMKNDDV